MPFVRLSTKYHLHINYLLYTVHVTRDIETKFDYLKPSEF